MLLSGFLAQLCVDEKSQIQALDRTQPLLPMRPGQAERRSHDYQRHGTTSLFAALDVKSGTVIGACHRRQFCAAWSSASFSTPLEQAVPSSLEVHLILDNYGTHKTAAIRAWLAKRPQSCPKQLFANLVLDRLPERSEPLSPE